MKLRYIGIDDLYNLTTGKVYDVDVFTKQSFIWVKVEGRSAAIPYSTPQAVAHNWETGV